MKTFEFDAAGGMTVRQDRQQVDPATGLSVAVSQVWTFAAPQLSRALPGLSVDMDAATLAQAEAIAAANP